MRDLGRTPQDAMGAHCGAVESDVLGDLDLSVCFNGSCQVLSGPVNYVVMFAPFGSLSFVSPKKDPKSVKTSESFNCEACQYQQHSIFFSHTEKQHWLLQSFSDSCTLM